MKAFTCKVSGLNLAIEHAQTIVSGGRNQYEVEFSFDETWNEFVLYAVFSTPKIEGIKTAIVENHCFIPNEILATEGIFELAILGVSQDKTYSSKPYSMSVCKGAGNVLETSGFESPNEWEEYILRIENLLETYLNMAENASLINGQKILTMTEEEYAVAEKDDDTLYFIME